MGILEQQMLLKAMTMVPLELLGPPLGILEQQMLAGAMMAHHTMEPEDPTEPVESLKSLHTCSGIAVWLCVSFRVFRFFGV